jgi:adenosylcobinamide-GDP ribazoletransferase
MRILHGLRVALGFLTVLPGGLQAATIEDIGRAAPWMPIVGLLIGIALTLWQLVAASLLPPLVAAVSTVMLWAALTGGLHLDGVADCGDGLLVTASAQRRLEIMRDPRAGTFGVLALLSVVLLKVATLGNGPYEMLSRLTLDVRLYTMGGRDGFWAMTLPLLAGPMIARWLMLWIARSPPARADGMGAAFTSQVTMGRLAAGALGPALVIAWGLGVGATWLVPAAAAGAAGVAALRSIARRRLGGVTGDVIGCAVEVAEVIVLVTWVGWTFWTP